MPDLFSREAEQSVLGGVFVSPVAFAEVAAAVSAQDFALEFHRRLFAAMVDLDRERQPIDLLTVCERLESQGQLTPEEFSACAVMVRETPSAANVLAYAGLVKNYAQRRALLTLADQLARWTRDERDAGVTLARLRTALAQLDTGGTMGPHLLSTWLPGVLDALDARANQTHGLLGLSTGLADVDRLLDGWCPGRLYTLAGRPGSGKSVFALNAVRAALADGKRVLLFTLEMPAQEAIHRLLAAEAPLSLSDLQAARLSASDWTTLVDTVTRLSPAPFWIDDSSQLALADLLARTRRLHRTAPLDLVVVDYIGLVDGERSKNGNRVEEVGSITRALKQLAKDLAIPVLAMAQLNRSLEQRADKRPILSDLRESGSIEQDSDVVAFIYRDDLYDPNSPDKGCAEVLVKKNRAGKLGMVALRFDAEHCRFQSLAGPLPSWQPPAPTSPAPARRGFNRGRPDDD